MSAAGPTVNADHYWGAVTSTIDWCEANYQFSRYIAEYANSFSNLFTVVLAVYGLHKSRQESLPKRYGAGYMGFMLVGLGSFLFHATLLYECQLADEIPMIISASYGMLLLFDTGVGFSMWTARAITLVSSIIAFNGVFGYTYVMSRNPVYHEFVFGCLVVANALRTLYVLRWSKLSDQIPEKTKDDISHLFSSGVVIFVLGFIIWNLDTFFCNTLTTWKVAVGWPLAFLLEGHSWWHYLSAYGTYLMILGIQYLTLCVKDESRNFKLGFSPFFHIPYVARVSPWDVTPPLLAKDEKSSRGPN